jgi:phage head maturation protease
MGLFSWLGRMTDEPTPVAATFSESTPKPITVMFAEMASATGSVSRTEALSVPAVLKGRNMITSIASLPLTQLGPDNEAVRNPLLEQIAPDVANVVTLAQTVADLLFDAVAWWRITAVGFDGYPLNAERVAPENVSPTPPGGRAASPLPSGQDPRRAEGVWIDGEFVPWSRVIRFDSPNPGVLAACSRAIRRAVRFDQAAERYARNPRPLDYFTPAAGAAEAEDEDIEKILSAWHASRQRESTAYVPEALDYNTVNTPSAADMQLVQLQKQVGLDLANALGVDPEDLGVSTTSRTYANVIDRRRDRINDVLAPYMRAITDRLSMPDVTKRGYRVLFDLTDYMKSNPTERWATYTAGKNLGVYTVNDIRRMEGLPPLPGGDEQPAPQEEPPVTNDVQADSPAALRFDADQNEHTFSFTADDVDHTFAADTQRRTVSGVALPYNKVTVKYGMKFRFKPGSIEYADVSRVKHYKDHMTPVGKALDLKNTRQALVATLSVANGATGDELLQLAEDGVYDGLSVGVDFSLDPESGDVALARDGVYDVLRASLREISSTPMPSFDDARMTKVVASRTPGGTSMTETTAPATEPTPAPVPAITFSAENIAEIRTALGLPEPTAPESRPVVNPARLTASTSVGEPLPYRFDRGGNFAATEHVFSTDLRDMQRVGDLEGTSTAAGKRVMDLLKATFDTDSADINELNPTINRPDMYVDQRDFQYPLWNAVSKGTPPNGTQPFAFPKFNTASGLVGAHTEGTEPTAGNFTTTAQTVTPTSISGKASLTREVYDMGGNPAVSTLVYNQMVRGYREGLESSTATFLNTLTAATDIALGVAVVDDALADAWDQALAGLAFVRGYDFSVFAIEQVLYKAFVGAEDTTGRRLYPILNPQNATGTASSRFRQLDLSGVVGTPSWALPSTAGSLNNSWLFDPSTVHGWATAPQRLEFAGTNTTGGYAPVAMVDIAIWGYQAFANSDLGGVRQVTYDSVV